jgi:hypothetical protein
MPTPADFNRRQPTMCVDFQGLPPGRSVAQYSTLVREWDRKSHRVMVMPDGFAWNGETFTSLSEIAFAITGTKWNGPRFFGLRDTRPQINAGEPE